MAATICPIELPSCYASLGCVFGRFVDVFHAEFRELRPEAVEIDAQFALPQALASLLFLGSTLLAEPRDLRCILAGHDNHAVGIAYNDIAGIHDSAGAHDRNVDRAGA